LANEGLALISKAFKKTVPEKKSIIVSRLIDGLLEDVECLHEWISNLILESKTSQIRQKAISSSVIGIL
jgi:hypothetical protein